MGNGLWTDSWHSLDDHNNLYRTYLVNTMFYDLGPLSGRRKSAKHSPLLLKFLLIFSCPKSRPFSYTVISNATLNNILSPGLVLVPGLLVRIISQATINHNRLFVSQGHSLSPQLALKIGECCFNVPAIAWRLIVVMNGSRRTRLPCTSDSFRQGAWQL